MNVVAVSAPCGVLPPCYLVQYTHARTHLILYKLFMYLKKILFWSLTECEANYGTGYGTFANAVGTFAKAVCTFASIGGLRFLHSGH